MKIQENWMGAASQAHIALVIQRQEKSDKGGIKNLCGKFKESSWEEVGKRGLAKVIEYLILSRIFPLFSVEIETFLQPNVF